MKNIILSIIAISLASLTFVLSGCEVSIGGEETQAETNIIEVTDEKGKVVGTEAVTISDSALEEAKDFFGKGDTDKTTQSGASSDRIQQGLNNGGKTEKPAEKTTTPKANSNKNDKEDTKPENLPAVQDDAQVLKSSQYMIIGRVEADGTSTPYKIARNGEKLAMYTEYNGNQLGVIILEDKIFILSAADKMYLEVSKELLKENTSDEEMLQMFSGSVLDRTSKVVKTQTKKEDGVVYDVCVYETGEKDYFLGGTLIKTVAPDGGILYYDMISAVAPSSVFAPPADYTKQTLNGENVSNFPGMVDSTHNHDHE